MRIWLQTATAHSVATLLGRQGEEVPCPKVVGTEASGTSRRFPLVAAHQQGPWSFHGQPPRNSRTPLPQGGIGYEIRSFKDMRTCHITYTYVDMTN